MSLLLAAIAPAAILLILIYKTDHFQPEPIGFLLKLYIFGMISVIPVIIVESILSFFNIFHLLGSDLVNLYDALVVAGFTEELFKWIIVLVFAFRSKEFDEYLDGIVYCVFVSLGFATVENILYVIEGSYYTAVLRALLSVPAHMLFGITMGYYLSLAKFSKKSVLKSRFFLLSLVLPIVIHGAYDYILMSNHSFLLILFIPFVIWMWRFNMKKLKLFYTNSRYHHSFKL